MDMMPDQPKPDDIQYYEQFLQKYVHIVDNADQKAIGVLVSFSPFGQLHIKGTVSEWLIYPNQIKDFKCRPDLKPEQRDQLKKVLRNEYDNDN